MYKRRGIEGVLKDDEIKEGDFFFFFLEKLHDKHLESLEGEEYSSFDIQVLL